VEVFHRKEIGAAIFQPLRTNQRLTFRAMTIPATVEGYPRVATGITLLDMSAERSGAAALDGAHDATLPATKRISVLLAITGPGLAKDVRHLKPGGTHVLSQK
jgi:hypothetical protein